MSATPDAPRQIAVFGGSFNPPGWHHRRLAELLTRHYQQVLVVPCGPRPDKETSGEITLAHRAALVELAFRDIPHVEVDLSDLRQGTFTRTHELQQRYAPRGEVWHLIGADLAEAGGEGRSFIHRVWQEGARLWNEYRFILVTRPGYDLPAEDRPPHHRLLEFADEGSSTKIREALRQGLETDGWVDPAVGAYLERHHLYRTP